MKARDRQLYNGILLGITGVLGIFLTAVFAANHKPIFPSAALVTWCVLAYLCVDFGFWHKLFQLRPEDNAVYRAATESAMAASLLVFLHIFLRLTAAHGLARMLLGVWIVAQLALVGLAFIDARLAATFARASFAAIGGVGILVTSYLALRGQDRALSLLPTWILFLVWLFAATVTLSGRMTGDAVISSLTGGLVLITVLVGFTVTQFAFRSMETHYGAAPSEQQLRSLAIDSSGASLWEWSVRRDEIKTGPMIETTLGLNSGELSAKAEDFCSHLHPADRERFRLLLWSVKERGGGELRLEFRLLHADNSYRWFDLEAAAVPSADRRALRCVGLIREITEAKRAQERLLHDAVHDSLTGLPNRELFIDRLGVAVLRAGTEPMVMPAVVLIDVDKFRSVNSSYGLVVGDSLLLTLARRLQRHLAAKDTLARIGGNQFALLMMQAHDAIELAEFAESIRRSVRAPIKIAGQDIVMTAALGIAIWDQKVASAAELLKEAEIAMYRAKRGGADKVETFREEMRSEVDNRVVVESELRLALDRKELTVLYQPIIAVATEELAGFEALVRWQHPKLGMLGPDDFIPIAEESDLIVRLGSLVLNAALDDAAEWHNLLPRVDRPLFVSVNISSRQLFRADLVQEVRHAIGRVLVPPGGLRLEVTESLVMENPERAVEVLDLLRAAGAGLSLDDFGTGYSSFAYLNRFPFDTIKIDRDLVQASAADGSGSAIVRSIVALSHELGKKVVAEGVELEADVAFLRSIGCELAQGYYYGEPVTQREVERMLRAIAKNERKMQRTSFFRNRAKRRKTNDAVPQPMVAFAGQGASAAGAPPGQPVEPAAAASPDAGQSISERLMGNGWRMRTPAKPAAGRGRAAMKGSPAERGSTAGTMPRGAGRSAGPANGRTDGRPPLRAATPPPSNGAAYGTQPPQPPHATPTASGYGVANGAAFVSNVPPPPPVEPQISQRPTVQTGWPPNSKPYPGRPVPPPVPQSDNPLSAPLANLAGILAGAAALPPVMAAPRNDGAAPPIPPAAMPPIDAPRVGANAGIGSSSGTHVPGTETPSTEVPTSRQARPAAATKPDLSNLPPAIAASLARLAQGNPASSPAPGNADDGGSDGSTRR